MRQKTSLTLFLVVVPFFQTFAGDQIETGRVIPYTGDRLPSSFVVEGEPPTVAIYNAKGSWETGVQGYEHLLKKLGITYREISTKQLLAGALESEDYKVLYMPGGASWQYLDDLGAEGARKVRDFVAFGGSYLGICAGAFYATSQRLGGHATGDYGIGLLQGTAYDGTALGTSPFVDGTLTFDISSDALVVDFARHYHWLLLGGPSLRYSEAEAQTKHIHVLSHFSEVNEPAQIAFDYGAGRVFLSAPHVEVEPGLITPSTGPKQDDGWPLLTKATQFLLWQE